MKKLILITILSSSFCFKLGHYIGWDVGYEQGTMAESALVHYCNNDDYCVEGLYGSEQELSIIRKEYSKFQWKYDNSIWMPIGEFVQGLFL